MWHENTEEGIKFWENETSFPAVRSEPGADGNGLIWQPGGARWDGSVRCFCGTGRKFALRRLSETSRPSWTRRRCDLPPVPVASPTVFAWDPDALAMSKPAARKHHWTSRVNECAVRKDARGDLNVPLRGGAESGEFAHIGPVRGDAVAYTSGELKEGELLLEVENLSISGLPLYDIHTLVRNCKGPVRLKTVRQGKRSQRRTRPSPFWAGERAV